MLRCYDIWMYHLTSRKTWHEKWQYFELINYRSNFLLICFSPVSRIQKRIFFFFLKMPGKKMVCWIFLSSFYTGWHINLWLVGFFVIFSYRIAYKLWLNLKMAHSWGYETFINAMLSLAQHGICLANEYLNFNSFQHFNIC